MTQEERKALESQLNDLKELLEFNTDYASLIESMDETEKEEYKNAILDQMLGIMRKLEGN